MNLHLHNTRLQIEKFVYSKGTNVALYNAEHSERYIVFKKELRRALFDQIKYIAEYKEVLPLLMSLVKSPDDPLLNQIATLLAKKTLANDIDLGVYLVWAGSQGGQAALDKLGIEGIFGLTDQRLVDYFADYSNLIIDSVDDYTKRWIAEKIREGRELGLSPFEVQEMLEEDGDLISDIRAERIVLTETAKAMSTIETEAAKRYGIEVLIWRTSLDERVCPICLPLEGSQKLVSQSMFKDGYEMPPAHVSCRCYMEHMIPENWVVPNNIWLGE